MSDYNAGSPRLEESPTKYNPKVIERKMQPQTDWANLIRQQQALAEEMINQEKEKKMYQKHELNKALETLVNEKQNNKKQEEHFNKEHEFQVSVARKQQYDQYLSHVKNEKSEGQRHLANEYERQRFIREEERKRKIEEEKQLEQKMIQDALDSLEKEKRLKEQKRQQFMHSVDSLMRDRETQKRMEQDKITQERLDQQRLMAENANNIQRREQNYRQYFSNVNDHQRRLEDMHNRRVADAARSKERQREEFVNRGVEEAKRKAEEEEAMKYMKKQEQLRSLGTSLKTKIQEHEEEKMMNKLGYRSKVEDLMKYNIQMQEFEDQQKRQRAHQMVDYKNTLESQIKMAEESKFKSNVEMLDYEKKMHIEQFNGLIPGIKSSKYAGLSISPGLPVPVAHHDLGSSRSSHVLSKSPLNNTAPFATENQQYNNYAKNLTSPTNFGRSQDNMYGPAAGARTDTHNHNPITNPIPGNLQNPYISREYQRGGPLNNSGSRNFLAGVARNNLII